MDASLQWLQADDIDFYPGHEDDARVPLVETRGAFDRLIEQARCA